MAWVSHLGANSDIYYFFQWCILRCQRVLTKSLQTLFHAQLFNVLNLLLSWKMFLQGYLFISVLVNSNSELIRLINNAIKNDLSSRNPTFMCLALHCIANVGSREMAEAFAGEIPRILVAGWVTQAIKTVGSKIETFSRFYFLKCSYTTLGFG